MKKTFIALAVLGSVAGVAQAQSAVTVYGKLDLGLQKQTGTPTSLESNHQSRLGFKGAEDLGGGLSAIFQIESRFNADTGAVRFYTDPTGKLATNPLFGGPSFVGLKGGFGTVILGRTFNAVPGSAAIDPFEGDGVAGLNALGNARNFNVRLSNTANYISPSVKGFSASAQAVLSETSGLKNGYGLAGAYDNGPISAGVGYQKLTQTAAGADQADIWGLYGAYAFGPAKVLLGYDLMNTMVPGAAKSKNLVVGATYEIGAGLIKAAYNQTKDGLDTTITGDAATILDKLQKVSIGYQHNLSKRTSVYADIARTKLTNGGVSNTANGVGLGLTHDF